MSIKEIKAGFNHSLLFLLVAMVGLITKEVSAANQWQSNANGTVTDIATGLTWQQQGNEFSGTNAESSVYCEGLSLGGSGNWRLPEVKELSSIVDYRVRRPSIDNAAFLNTISNSYWSASMLAADPSRAWRVSFGDGQISGLLKTSNLSARCVR